MSRYAASQNIASAVCSAVLQKETTYREPITENMGLVEAAASTSHELEESLRSMMEYVDDESIFCPTEIQEFLQEERGRLKQIAAANVQNSRQVDVFLDSVRALKQVEEQKFDNAVEQEAADDADNTDPGQRLGVIYEQTVQAKSSSMQIEVHQEKHFRKVCEALGETNDMGGDDEIQFVAQSSTQQSFICPITATLLEDPVKNRACGHVYSKTAILSMIRQRRGSCKCPVVGCANTQVTQGQLDSDLMTEQLLKRERRKQEHEKEMRLSQADPVDSEDED